MSIYALLWLAAIGCMSMALYYASPPALDTAILLVLWAAFSAGIVTAAYLLVRLVEDRRHGQ